MLWLLLWHHVLLLCLKFRTVGASRRPPATAGFVKGLFLYFKPLQEAAEHDYCIFTIFLENVPLRVENNVQTTVWNQCFHQYAGTPGWELKRCSTGGFFLSGAHKTTIQISLLFLPPGTCGYDASMFLQESPVVPAPPVSFSLSFPATAPLGGSCHIVSPSSRCSPSAIIFLPLRQYY